MHDTGWLTPSAAVVIADGSSTWSNPNNSFASDNVYVTSSISSYQYSDTLRVSGFAANIPENATILGIEVQIERKGSSSSYGIADYRVQLFNGTTRTGENKASGTTWSTSDTVASYGSASTLWNAGITIAQANSLATGIDFAARNTSTMLSRTASVDQVRIRYTYSLPVIQDTEFPVDAISSFALNPAHIAAAILSVNGVASVEVTAQQINTAPDVVTIPVSSFAHGQAVCLQVRTATVGIQAHTGFSITPALVRQMRVSIEVSTDFTIATEQVLNNRVKYTLTHPVYGTRMYEVVVRVVQSSLNMIDRFWFAAADNAGLAADIEGVVSGEEVSVTLPHGTNLRALKPIIDVSIEATVVPASGVVRDFSAPVEYEVTAETGVSRVFTVRASVMEAVGKSIVRFNVLRALNPLLPVDLVADVTESAVTMVSPNVADVVLAALKPTVQISEGASVVPASTQVRDFRGTVPYRVTAGDGSSAVYSADMYRRADVGSPSVAGHVSVSGGVFTMLGSGTDIWGSSDKFFFVFRSMTGDCWAEVLLESQQATNDWAKVGLMVRSTLLGNSVHAFVGMAPLLDGSNRTLFVSHRLTTGGTSVMPFQGGVEGPPLWLRLEKLGTEIRAYRKTVAGSTWTLVQSVTVPLIGSTAYVGFAVCSHTTGLGECVFRGLRVG